MSNLRLSLSWLCLVNLCRLRVEGSGRQCVRCIIRLELQRHLQICRPDQGSPSALRREWECNLECKALNPRFSTETTLVYKDCTYTDIEKSHGWTECDTEDGDQTVHCFACWQPDEECLRLREECALKCAWLWWTEGVFFGCFGFLGIGLL